MEKIGIVVVDYNNHTDTIEFLDSLKEINTSGFDVRTFLVDNGSDYYLGDEIPENNKEYEVLQTGENKGFAGGYNFGIAYALNWGADFVFAINNDTLIGDINILQKLVKTIKNDSKIAVVSPKILFAKGFEYHKDRYTQSEVGHVIWYGGGYIDWNNIFGKNKGIDEVDNGQYDLIEQTDFISGCCFLAKAGALNEVGLFEEKLFAYFEDVDLMLRLKKKGYKLFYNGNTHIYHKVSRTAGIASKLTDYLITRNRLFIGFKYAPIKLRYSLWKESLKHLINGREAQKKGILDFFRAKYPNPSTLDFLQVKNKELNIDTKIKYPLDLSIVIVNYKTKELTLELLESIFANNSGFEKLRAEVIVLDNGSNDQIGVSLKYKYPEVKFIGLSQNTGFAKGYNNAIRYSKSEYILLLNSDIKIIGKALPKLQEFAKKKKGEAIVAGKLNLANGEVQRSCFKLPTINGALKEYFLGMKDEYSLYAPQKDTASRVEGVVMACFLIPRKILNKIGYLTEDSFLYFEDVEYCRRLKKEGVKIYYYPKTRFLHYHGASSEKIGKANAYDYLKKGAISYHGLFRYLILTSILWLGQKKNLLINFTRG